MKRDFASTWKHDIIPMVMKKSYENKKFAYAWRHDTNGVVGHEIVRGNVRHTVNIENEMCSCKEQDLTGIPCPYLFVLCFL